MPTIGMTHALYKLVDIRSMRHEKPLYAVSNYIFTYNIFDTLRCMRSPSPSSLLRFGAAVAGCLAFRLLPWRPPNVEPVMTAMLPFCKRLGPLWGFGFGTLNMLLFDALTGEVGTWTLVTAITYGTIGAAAYPILTRMRGKALSYALMAASGTIVYDGVTGVLMGNLLFDMPLREAFIGQIPFTVNHLLGNVVLAFVVSPLIERWIARGESALPVGPRPAST